MLFEAGEGRIQPTAISSRLDAKETIAYSVELFLPLEPILSSILTPEACKGNLPTVPELLKLP